ncbi:MAG: putative sugar kinase [halophilic archaeon J07HB67]|nr:MAG: putative sugar kinase [halophilic archaeon J07HB67]
MYVGIVAQRANDRAASLASSLRDRLHAASVEVGVDRATAAALDVPATPVDEFDTADLVVSVGGDGTFLYAAHGAGDTPVLGVNLGEVGFLNAVDPDDAETAVMQAVTAFRDGEQLAVRAVPRIAAAADDWQSRPAVNEIVVGGPRRGHGGAVDVTVRVDGSVYTAGRADGVLIATPTGSTAYNLSERGPLVHPALDALVVNEMAAADGMPPLAVGADATVTVTVDAGEAVVVSDGRDERHLDTPTTVTVAATEPPVRVAGPTTDFFGALDKLT